MNLDQIIRTVIRAAIWRLMWRAPTWFLWTIVGLAFVAAVLRSMTL
jgi:hypothetical protein